MLHVTEIPGVRDPVSAPITAQLSDPKTDPKTAANILLYRTIVKSVHPVSCRQVYSQDYRLQTTDEAEKFGFNRFASFAARHGHTNPPYVDMAKPSALLPGS